MTQNFRANNSEWYNRGRKRGSRRKRRTKTKRGITTKRKNKSEGKKSEEENRDESEDMLQVRRGAMKMNAWYERVTVCPE